MSALLTDVAEYAGVPFARLGAGTLQGLRTILSPALVPDNPLDAWDALKARSRCSLARCSPCTMTRRSR